MVQLTVKITAAEGRGHQLVEALHELMRRALQTKGCAAAHVAADVDQSDAYWYCEDWQDTGALEGRVRSDHFSQLLALMETSTEQPTLEFRVIEELRGLDYVAAVRGVAP